jgi:hypothetical protein
MAAALALAVATTLVGGSTAAGTIGKSFGNGVAGFPLCAKPVTLVNHTLSAGATHGDFWPHFLLVLLTFCSRFAASSLKACCTTSGPRAAR